MANGNGTLVIFTRYPVPGRTKTRLAGVLGPEGAAELHRTLAEHALRESRQTAHGLGLRLEVHHTDDDDAMARWLGDDLVYRPQVDGDLGARMHAAFAATSSPTVIIGTDCPDCDESILVKSFAALQNHDLVLGPAVDGGYYLIGLNTPQEALFQNIVWGGDQVLRRTLARAAALDLDVALLATLADIDRPEDLARLHKERF